MITIIGIIGALDREVSFFIENLKEVEKVERASMIFYTGLIDGEKIVVVKSGVGKVNAAVCTQILIDDYKPDAIICTGVAGALKDELNLGDTVISQDVVQHDIDGTSFGHELGEIPNLNIKEIKACSKFIQMARKAYEEEFQGKKVHIGRILTGDQFISDRKKVDFLRRTFDGSCVEMEGGAIGQVCYLNSMPFLIIRSISDKADGTAVCDFNQFADEVAEKSYRLVRRIIKMLKVENKE